MENLVLSVEDVSIKLKKFNLKHISFQLPAGYILGIIGCNGAGKTTLMKVLQNIYIKNKGTVTIAGFDTKKHEVEAKNAVGFIMDQPFFDQLSLEDNAKMFGDFYENYNHKLFLEYLIRFNLDKGKELGKLSKGMITKFQLAFALSHQAKLLILDEPTGGLDPIFRREFLEILQDVVETEEVSVIISTHITSDLDKVADYIALIDQGEMVFYMPKEDLMDQFRIVKGSRELLRKIPRECFVAIRSYAHGFQGLTRDYQKCESYCCDTDELVTQIPSIEEIMYFIHKERRELHD